MTIVDFLKDLALDAKKVKAFTQDPVAALDSAGLSVEEKNAILSGDLGKVRQAAVGNLGAAGDTVGSKGSLIVVGTGYQVGQATFEAQSYITNAEKVVYFVVDPVCASWIRGLNANAESLESFYGQNKDRRETYNQIIERILEEVRAGKEVCAVFYGHPGVFVYPAHTSIRRARKEGYEARMLPGISAEDCLFADLGVDPGRDGCQSFEVTDFLIRRRVFDPSNILILWQIGALGDLTWKGEIDYMKVTVLQDYLMEYYSPEHEAIFYEAPRFCICEPLVQKTKLAELSKCKISICSTLCLLPERPRRPIDQSMVERLGISLNP